MNESRQYRKRPIVIEAVQWFKNGDHPDDGPPDQEGNVVRYFRRPEPEFAGKLLHHVCGERWHVHGWIDTLEGGHTVCPGDWIIKGVLGEVYPCKPDIFEATYEPVSALQKEANVSHSLTCPTCDHRHPGSFGIRLCACEDCGLLWSDVPYKHMAPEYQERFRDLWERAMLRGSEGEE